MWEGECFVFDGCIVVIYGVEEGFNIKCYVCGWLFFFVEVEEVSYEYGVLCKYCIDNIIEK